MPYFRLLGSIIKKSTYLKVVEPLTVLLFIFILSSKYSLVPIQYHSLFDPLVSHSHHLLDSFNTLFSTFTLTDFSLNIPRASNMFIHLFSICHSSGTLFLHHTYLYHLFSKLLSTHNYAPKACHLAETSKAC